jgi:bifunctional DNA-binding transcriptional regulator/antitoxin component of YhaV-PrlF toxin-antitoxin module
VQITIPHQIAKAVGIAVNDEVRVYLVGQVMCVQRVDVGGFLPGVVAVRPALRTQNAGLGE